MRGRKDPSIPRHPRGGKPALSPTTGRFVRYADTGKVLLTDNRGNWWQLPSVTILTGSWGFSEEGIEKLPRPWEYIADGQPLVSGDIVIIDFLDGSWRRPVVRGGVRSVQASSFFARDHDASGANDNRLRVRLTPMIKGVQVGEVQVKACDDDLGSVELLVSESVKIGIGPIVETIQAPVTTIEASLTGVTVVSAGPVDVTAAAGASVTAGGAVEITAAEGVTVEAVGAVEVSSLEGVEVTGALGVTIAGATEVVVDSATVVKLGEGAAEAVMKGATFQTIYNTHTHTISTGSSAGVTTTPDTPLTGAELSTLVLVE